MPVRTSPNISTMLTQLRGLAEAPTAGTAAQRKQAAYDTVRAFWQTYGAVLERDNGPGSFKYDFVQKMKALHQDTTHTRILDILSQQRKYVYQFDSCLDQFNKYLAALRLLDTCLQHGI